jgi:hypothetical protein
VPKASRLKYFFLGYLSRPAGDRCVYRSIRRRRQRRIVELGVHDALRALRMISVAQAADGAVSYTGIDLFELRPDGERPKLALKEAYRRLRSTGVAVRLIPGDPWQALSRAANALTGTDLLIVSADQDPSSLDRAWFYVPRMLHDGSLVYRELVDERTGALRLQAMPREEVERLAAAAAPESWRAAPQRRAA